MDGNSIADLGSLLNVLTENPEALNAMGSLMGVLSKNKKSPEAPPKQSDSDALLGLLGSLGGNKNSDVRADNPVSKLFGSKDDIHNRIALLNAVKPYLSPERRDKLEGVVKLLKLTELGELGGLLSKM